MSDSGGQWQVARRRKGTARRAQPPGAANPARQEEMDPRRTLRRVRETQSELKSEDFWQEWKGDHHAHYASVDILWALMKLLLLSASTASSKPPADDLVSETLTNRLENNKDDGTVPEQECVCYGLGSFSSCVSSRYQLAMLLLLLDTLQIPPRHCCVFDPVFSAGEKDVLRGLGLTVLEENEEGKRLTTKPTLFYLMHCGKALYNNLLWRNWNIETLPLLTVIGNSFTGIQNRMIEREFQRDYSYITQAVAVCEERSLPCPSRLQDVFNDTAIITFPTSSLSKLPPLTWAEPPEPQYEHCPVLEIILKDKQS